MKKVLTLKLIKLHFIIQMGEVVQNEQIWRCMSFGSILVAVVCSSCYVECLAMKKSKSLVVVQLITAQSAVTAFCM